MNDANGNEGTAPTAELKTPDARVDGAATQVSEFAGAVHEDLHGIIGALERGEKWALDHLRALAARIGLHK